MFDKISKYVTDMIYSTLDGVDAYFGHIRTLFSKTSGQ